MLNNLKEDLLGQCIFTANDNVTNKFTYIFAKFCAPMELRLPNKAPSSTYHPVSKSNAKFNKNRLFLNGNVNLSFTRKIRDFHKRTGGQFLPSYPIIQVLR